MDEREPRDFSDMGRMARERTQDYEDEVNDDGSGPEDDDHGGDGRFNAFEPTLRSEHAEDLEFVTEGEEEEMMEADAEEQERINQYLAQEEMRTGSRSSRSRDGREEVPVPVHREQDSEMMVVSSDEELTMAAGEATEMDATTAGSGADTLPATATTT